MFLVDIKISLYDLKHFSVTNKAKREEIRKKEILFHTICFIKQTDKPGLQTERSLPLEFKLFYVGIFKCWYFFLLFLLQVLL